MSKDLFIVIDMQNVYLEDGKWYCPNVYKAQDNIIKVINSAQTNNDIDVVFTRFIASKNPAGTWKEYNIDNKAVNEDEYANELTDSLKSYTRNYPVYDKDTYSSVTVEGIKKLINDRLEDASIVVSGVVADCCVLFTATELIDMGASVIYLTDAVAGIDDNTQEAVITALKGLSPMHIRFMTTQEYLENR